MTAVPDRPAPLPWPAPDRLLLARIAKGDERAARVFAHRLEGALYAIAYGVLFAQEQATAVVEEAIVRAPHNAAYPRDTGLAVRRWLPRVTRSLPGARGQADVAVRYPRW